jgi:hypothetical protein
MSRPHTEGVFYTIRSWSCEEEADILDRWMRAGIWDQRITRWEVGALEAEERAAAGVVYKSIVKSTCRGTPSFGCPLCGMGPTPHCHGCAVCPGMSHAWWCHGGMCICGCPESRHHHKTVAGVTRLDGKPYIVARRCRGRLCGCRKFVDVEYQGAYLTASLTDEERAALQDLLQEALMDLQGRLMDLAFGFGPFDGLDP